ncbi:IS110 family transposase [Alicyclobacillus fastidiosus]|uniref:IS110 family transposase n=1 Tax=Alicyclobacillus fastidiosus TaxID=392011 RepID=A0ABY6ZBP8_9BACL|nr:IS110 family transposase [Alicyclobacillus fastidiosus]WAH40262.1 IS110 family transposase [Alicyclobacillus fastidiosus]GMA61630.1 IS110 family transposase ISDha12 [Alicyclobacillus fastidiosus]
MSICLYVGVDLGLNNFVVCTVNDQGKQISGSSKFSNDLVGAERFVDNLLDVARSAGAKQLKIGMEATNLYWWHLHEYLVQNDELQSLEMEVYVLNPSLVDGFKRAYTKLPKTDAVDAWVIADRLRFGGLRPTPPQDPRYAALQRLTRFRYHLVQDITREKNRALGIIFMKFASMADGKQNPFSDTFGKAATSVLSELAPDEIAEQPIEDLAQFIAERSNNRLRNPNELAQELRKLARRSYRLNPHMEDAIDVTLSMMLGNIQFLEKQLKELDKVIARHLAAIPQTLDTIPGIGPVITAGIVAEIGDISRFNNQAALAKFAGLTWSVHQSSSFRADETKLTKAGNYYLRYYLIEAANSLRVHNKEYAEFCRRKYREATKHHHKRGLVLSARKFVRLVFVLLSKGQIYNARKVVS